jgi:hypothetical protein
MACAKQLWLPKQAERALAAWLRSGSSSAGMALWGEPGFMRGSYEELYFEDLAARALEQVCALCVDCSLLHGLLICFTGRGWPCCLGLLCARAALLSNRPAAGHSVWGCPMHDGWPGAPAAQLAAAGKGGEEEAALEVADLAELSRVHTSLL